MTETKPEYKVNYDKCGYIEVRGDGDFLLFKFDPLRDLIQIKPKNGRLQVVDLRPYRHEEKACLSKMG